MRKHCLEQTGRRELLVQAHQRVQERGSTAPGTDNKQRRLRFGLPDFPAVNQVFGRCHTRRADTADRQVGKFAPVPWRDAKTVLDEQRQPIASGDSRQASGAKSIDHPVLELIH